MPLRYKLMNKVITENGIDIYDITSIDWTKFYFRNGYSNYTVTKTDCQKPYLISMESYGTIEYEDFIFLINNIPNPLELIPGQKLKIPDIQDIRYFLLENRK